MKRRENMQNGHEYDTGSHVLIHPELTIKQLITQYPNSLHFFKNEFFGYGFPDDFNCALCPMAGEESLEEAALSHGIDIDLFITGLKRYLTIPA